ncbi:Nonsense-mediated mRNA decay protein 5 [Malassezia psittaci]|uniref:Nonsense-mediated mRNA decay protein 5 n=1 Tax=Malassezia psittaci TaxID=1821823 RepID=A0AAF0FCV7_9BASI|nr:Nonsense-mediated mRNA decay protein 5 [Malassezia psittaci]
MIPQTILDLPSVSSSPDVNQRRASELELRRLEAQPGMLSASFQLIASDQVDLAVRQAAAIYAKNRIAQAWDSNTSRSSNVTPVPDEDREAVRGSLLETIALVPNTLRVHIASSIYSISRCDFPDRWPSLLNDIMKLLASQQEAHIYAGVRALLETVRGFRFADSDQKLEQVVAQTFPQLLSTTSALLDSEQSDLPAVGEIVYYALKTYKTSMLITLTKHLQTQESIVSWGTLMLKVVQKPIDDSALASDPEERAKLSWWKAKKWAYYSLNKLFSRYGIPSQLAPGMRSYKPFAEIFLANFAPEILKAYLHVVEANVTQQQWLSPPVTRSLLNFFQACVKPKSIWLQLRPHMQQLIEAFVYPRLCFSDQDQELWDLDPIDFVRVCADPYDDIGTVTSSASFLLSTAVSKRTKSMFEPTLQFITSVLNAYPENASARQLDGALRMSIAISSTMVNQEMVKDNLDAFFVQHVLPLLKSPEAFLRLRACAAIQTFDQAGLKWQSHQSLESALHGVMDCIMDSELPVRVQAASAMGELIAHDEVHNAIAPNAGRLMQELLKLSDETDMDVLMTTQEKVVSNFAEELLPFAVQLVQQMANSYMRLVQENIKNIASTENDQTRAFGTDQGEEDKYFAAMGCLSTMYQIVTTAENRPEILAELEKVLLPVVAFTLESESIDLYDDCFQLTDVLTYYQKRISPEMWNIFVLMYKSFKGSGIDYLAEMLGTFDNCASYGTEVLQQNAEYRNMLLDIFQTAMTSDQLGTSDRIAACQLGEVVLLLLKGYVDEAIPNILATVLPLLNEKHEHSSTNLRKWCIMLVLEAIYYNPSLALQVLESHNATADFFTHSMQKLGKFTKVHECKVTIVALLTLLSLDPDSIPETVKHGYAHLFIALVTQLKLLPASVAERNEYQRQFDEGLESDIEDEFEETGDYDDDVDVQDDENQYLELLTQEAQKLRSKIAQLDETGSVDDDEDDDALADLDGDDLIYESPLENVPVYEPFRQVVNQLKNQHGSLFENLSAQLNEEQRQHFQEVYQLQDTPDTGVGKADTQTQA